MSSIGDNPMVPYSLGYKAVKCVQIISLISDPNIFFIPNYAKLIVCKQCKVFKVVT